MQAKKATHRPEVTGVQSNPSRFRVRCSRVGLMVGMALLFPTLVRVQATTQLSAEDDIYLQRVRPLLQEKCWSCHGAIRQEGGLRLDAVQLIRQGGDSGPAVHSGTATETELWHRITATDELRMPPEGEGTPFSAEQLAEIQQWIQSGAGPESEAVPASPTAHWAFQPIPSPSPAQETLAQQVDGSLVNAVLEDLHRSRGLSVARQADRPTLIRRVYLDLIGLPPTVDQLRDQRSFETIVDELLASPAYGERWGRHFMDLWRYSDWYGLNKQLRYSQKHIWHWRDWILENLNADTGYDQMILEMLAGDELAPTDPRTLRATGFLARNYYLFNRDTWLENTVEHTAKAFLGLTYNCARCHDHKYDPISQREYYQFRAFFEPHQVRLDPVPGVLDLEEDGLPRVYDDAPQAPTWLYRRGNTKDPVRDESLLPTLPEVIRADFAEPVEMTLPAAGFLPALRTDISEGYLSALEAELRQKQLESKGVRRRLAAAEVTADESVPGNRVWTIDESFEGSELPSWQLRGDGWEIKDGRLQLTKSTRNPVRATLREEVPRDFECVLTYRHTGGDVYRSVTVRFDESDDGETCNFVYTSAHAPGPKLQIAYERRGQSAYPADGLRARAVPLNETLELRFAVRDRLINVWLNDEFQLAYKLPDRSPTGRLSLSGFDATVAFDRFQLRPLPASELLRTPESDVPVSPDELRQAAELAEQDVVVLQARLIAAKATLRADRLHYEERSVPELQRVEATRAAAMGQANVRLQEAERSRLAADTDAAREKAERGLEAAQQHLRKVEATEAPEYDSLKLSRKALESPAHNHDDYSAVYSSRSTGRRTALARWMTSRQNPLTARVIVNHVWMRHFGTPIVEPVFDFGLRTPVPRLHAVLDALAADLMQHNWSLKRLHRQLVLSDIWKSQSRPTAADKAGGGDPLNLWMTRMNPRRMESQVIRDSLLSLGGQLDKTFGGPSVEPAPESRRRSVYFLHSRDQQNKLISMFDDANLLQCYRRTVSIVPQQGLALFNSALSFDMAAAVRGRIEAESEKLTNKEFVQAAFHLLLAREATSGEQKTCLEFLSAGQTEERADQVVLTRTRLVHVLLNHHHFVTVR